MPKLNRRLGLPLLVLYGLGTTIGAGVYALMGEVAGRAGMHAPLAFLFASALAALSALSFAELSSRHPKSAGEAEYVRQAFDAPRLAKWVGLLVVLAGSVSAATVANGFAGYLSELVVVPKFISITGMITILTLVAIAGIGESMIVAGMITLIEIGALLLIIVLGSPALADLDSRWHEILVLEAPGEWIAVSGAGVLAFYAFLGFEDMVNVAEEVKDVRRALPAGIILTLIFTTAIYITLSTVCVLAVPPEEIARSAAPLALVYSRLSGQSPVGLGLVGMLAMVNGALIQIIMASRILYGLARQNLLPPTFGHVNSRTRTPVRGTIVIGVFVTALGLWFPLAPLALTTSFIALVVFAVVNAALLRIKHHDPHPEGVWTVHAAIPALALVATSAVFVFEIWRRTLSG